MKQAGLPFFFPLLREEKSRPRCPGYGKALFPPRRKQYSVGARGRDSPKSKLSRDRPDAVRDRPIAKWDGRYKYPN